MIVLISSAYYFVVGILRLITVTYILTILNEVNFVGLACAVIALFNIAFSSTLTCTSVYEEREREREREKERERERADCSDI